MNRIALEELSKMSHVIRCLHDQQGLNGAVLTEIYSHANKEATGRIGIEKYAVVV